MGRKKMSLSKKCQHQMWVASESPDPSYDLSECELKEIPEGVFSTCKVAQKEALILHSNDIESLTSNGNKVENLFTLLVLDFHSNKLSKLPAEIRALSQLQVMNISHNKISVLPVEIKQLKALQTLNVSDNKLSNLPEEIGELSSLRSLNISTNKITKLPKSMCRLRTLETLTVEVSSMQYPSKDVCAQGIEAIMRKLCADGGVDYIAPSKAVLPILKSSAAAASVNAAIAHLHPDNVQVSLSSYEETRRRKQEENLLIEREKMDDQVHLDQLLRLQQQQKSAHIAGLSKDNTDCEANITALQAVQESNRLALYNLIIEEDNRATELIDDIFRRNNATNSKREALLQELEDERLAEEHQVEIMAEELAMLRRGEMMSRMAEVLKESQGFEVLVSRYMNVKDENIRSTKQQFVTEDGILADKLTTLGAERIVNMDNLMQEEDWQMKALEALMKQKDQRHAQLTNDISSLESQLARLSIVELSNKAANNQHKLNMLSEQRVHLIQLLQQLMEQRDIRAKEIARRMVEMEEARESDLADYWLCQMQRLLDRKPQSQIDRETQLEIAVKDILSLANADDYIPRFAQHKISIESMKKLTDEDLRRIGVHEVGVRKSIMDNTESYLRKTGDTPTPDKLEKQRLSEATGGASPTAPISTGSTETEPSSPSEILTHVTTECVVCLERQTSIVFLPCGHVCCCLECSQPLLNCPMCRALITQKIILER